MSGSGPYGPPGPVQPFWPRGGYNPQTSILAGLPTAQLQAMLQQAQLAYGQLMAGGKPVTVSYAQGDGARSVTYAPAQAGQLVGWILQLQKQLGIPTPGRRPIRPIFR